MQTFEQPLLAPFPFLPLLILLPLAIKSEEIDACLQPSFSHCVVGERTVQENETRLFDLEDNSGLSRWNITTDRGTEKQDYFLPFWGSPSYSGSGGQHKWFEIQERSKCIPGDNVISVYSAWILAHGLIFGHRALARFHIYVVFLESYRGYCKGVRGVSCLLLHSPGSLWN